MNNETRGILLDKRDSRQQLRSLPFSEKLKLLEKLRERNLAIARSPLGRRMRKRVRLRSISRRIADLVRSVPTLRDPLDLLLGAVYALLMAAKLDYDDRLSPLPEEYWEQVSRRAERMAEGYVRERGKWAAGFYFNSALLRIAASGERVRCTPRERLPRPAKGSQLHAVQEEVNNLKHATRGLESGRGVAFDNAIRAAEELLDLIETQKADFNQGSVKAVSQSTPRHR